MSDREPKPEFVTPPDTTENDLFQLNIELQNLGVGTVNHIMAGTIQSLILDLASHENEGWTQEDRDKFLANLGKIKKHIAGEKMLRAMRMDKPTEG